MIDREVEDVPLELDDHLEANLLHRLHGKLCEVPPFILKSQNQDRINARADSNPHPVCRIFSGSSRRNSS